MSQHGTIRRYTLIIEKVSRKTYPSFGEIKEFLFDHGFEISARTIQRDIEQIRFEFGIEIKYDRKRNGYYIFEEKSINMDTFLRFLEIVNTAELLTESLKESSESLNYISFESQGSLKGLEYLKPILFAIKNNRVVTFEHENFVTGKRKKYTINPYLLKEYQNRWYLVGIPKKMKEFRTFGIDRIHEFTVLDRTFKPDKRINPQNLFENTIGLTYSLNKLEEVILSFTPFQGKYIKSLPLHQSQEVIVDNDREFVIKLRIIPNFEFQQKLLMLRENVKVVAPKWLAEEMKSILEATLKNYE